MPLLTVNEVMIGARDAHLTFDEKRHPAKVLLRALSAYHRRLLAKVGFSSAPAVSISFDTALPLLDFDAGIPLPDYIIIDGARTTDGSTPPIKGKCVILPWEKRDAASVPFPSIYVQGTTVNDVRTERAFLSGKVTDWVRYKVLTITYVPAPADLATGDTMQLPQTGYDAVTGFLVSLMAERGSGDKDFPGPDAGRAKANFKESESAFLDELAGRRRAVTSTITEVF